MMIKLISDFREFLKSKKQNEKCGKYPCIDYLNNSLRLLLREDNLNEDAISEICYCIRKADGKIYDDVIESMNDKGISTRYCR